jgi:hypothetical protein
MNNYTTLQFISINNQLIKTTSHNSVISSNYNNPNLILNKFIGDRYWINGVGQFNWSDQDFNIAIYLGNDNWKFEKTRVGSLVYIEEDDLYRYFNGISIQPFLSSTLDRHAESHQRGGSDIISLDAGLF